MHIINYTTMIHVIFKKHVFIRIGPELSLFSHRTLGGKRSMTAYVYKKNSFMEHCESENGSQNQHFQSTLLVGRERWQNRVLCACS